MQEKLKNLSKHLGINVKINTFSLKHNIYYSLSKSIQNHCGGLMQKIDDLFYFSFHLDILLVYIVGCEGIVQLGGPVSRYTGGPSKLGSCKFCL